MEKITRTEMKNTGIFLTPMCHVEKLVNRSLYFIKRINITVTHVLEPSFGLGHMFQVLNDKFYNVQMHGVELNKHLYNSAVKDLMLTNENKLTLLHKDFLKYKPSHTFDFIIGNPPYFMIKKTMIDSKYHKYFDRQPNIYVVFILKCLELLKDGGLLSFIVPINFTNCSSYKNVRTFIYTKFKICDIVHMSAGQYSTTCQDTCSLIIYKPPNHNAITHDNKRFTMSFGNNVILNSPGNIKLLNTLCKNTTNLKQLDMTVHVGTIKKSQNKDMFTNKSTGYLLIDTCDTTLNIKKKNAEKLSQVTNRPLVVVSRGFGHVKYNFRYKHMSRMSHKFVIGNNLLYIQTRDARISKASQKHKISMITKSFKDKRTTEFIDLYLLNYSMNCNDLLNILPIYNVNNRRK